MPRKTKQDRTEAVAKLRETKRLQAIERWRPIFKKLRYKPVTTKRLATETGRTQTSTLVALYALERVEIVARFDTRERGALGGRPEIVWKWNA